VRGLGLALGVLLVVGVVAATVVAWRVVVVVFVSILLGSAIGPLVDRGRERLPIPRGLAILSLYASLLVIVVGVALVFIPGALAEADGIRTPAGHAGSRRSLGDRRRAEVIGSTVASLTDAARAGLLRDVPLGRRRWSVSG
jgi:hypothetical protein